MTEFSGKSKIWIYQSERHLTESDISKMGTELTEFCAQWTAHNQQLKAGFRILHNRFIVLIVDETQTDASGCSIDKSVAFLKTLSNHHKTDLFGRLNMAYLDQGELKTAQLSELENLFVKGEINKDTLFFNTNIRTLEEMNDQFILPLYRHWLASRVITLHQ